MTDPVHLYSDSEIKDMIANAKLKTCLKTMIATALIVCAITYILTDAKYMNKPIVIREIASFNIPDGIVWVDRESSDFIVKENSGIKVKEK